MDEVFYGLNVLNEKLDNINLKDVFLFVARSKNVLRVKNNPDIYYIREQLGIFNINDKLMQYKLNWREHIQRMDDNRLYKKNTNLKGEEI